MAIYRLRGKSPDVGANVYVAECARVIGNVVLENRCSVWFGAVIRGDNGPIRIGAASNVQDGAILHASPGTKLTIGSDVTVGHQATLHGCTVGDRSLIGIQAVILDNAVIGHDSLVAAGSVVLAGKCFPPRSLIKGTPAEVVRELRPDELDNLVGNARRYVSDAADYLETLERTDAPRAISERW
mgnify:CR=1 FL=1